MINNLTKLLIGLGNIAAIIALPLVIIARNIFSIAQPYTEHKKYSVSISLDLNFITTGLAQSRVVQLPKQLTDILPVLNN